MNKRERIIEAAIEIFCSQGYEATSMADVAQKAGVGKGTLYLYVESKESLFEEAYKLCYEERAIACSAHVDEVYGALDKLCQRLRNGTRWEIECPLKNKLERVYLAHPLFGERERTLADVRRRARAVGAVFGKRDGDTAATGAKVEKTCVARQCFYEMLHQHLGVGARDQTVG